MYDVYMLRALRANLRRPCRGRLGSGDKAPAPPAQVRVSVSRAVRLRLPSASDDGGIIYIYIYIYIYIRRQMDGYEKTYSEAPPHPAPVRAFAARPGGGGHRTHGTWPDAGHCRTRRLRRRAPRPHPPAHLRIARRCRRCRRCRRWCRRCRGRRTWP